MPRAVKDIDIFENMLEHHIEFEEHGPGPPFDFPMPPEFVPPPPLFPGPVDECKAINSHTDSCDIFKVSYMYLSTIYQLYISQQTKLSTQFWNGLRNFTE